MKKKFMIILFIIALFSLFVYAEGYHWLCMFDGDMTPEGCDPNDDDEYCYECEYERCLVCVNENGYVSKPSRCSGEDQCSWDGDGDDDFDQEPPVLTVVSPLEGDMFDDDRITLEAYVDKTSQIKYYDYLKERWYGLCNSCMHVDDEKNFNEGWQHILFYARKLNNDLTAEEEVYFLVDSEEPDFSSNKFLPKRNKYGNGEFTIVYDEEGELVSMILHYGIVGDMREFDMSYCETGERIYCSASVDLSDFDGREDLQYYAVAEDHFRSATSDIIEDVKVDIAPPGITFMELTIDEDDVTFYIEVSERVDVDYMDLMDDNPRWRSLDGNADVGDPVDKRKRFDDGNHEVIIKLEDEAELVYEESVEFYIDGDAPKFYKNSFLPKKRRYGNGEFVSKYTEEEELVSMILYYGVVGDMREFDMSYCETGERIYCSASVDLNDFDGREDLQYYFVASDLVNVVESEMIEDVKVDITSPGITFMELYIDEDDVTFYIEVSEEVDVDYMDLMDDNPRWRSLDGNADVGDPVDKRKRFDDGNHEVIIKLEDEAELVYEESVEFYIES